MAIQVTMAFLYHTGLSLWTQSFRHIVVDMALTCAVDERVGCQQLKRVHFEEERVKEELPRARSLRTVAVQTLEDEVLLLRVVQRLDRAVDVLIRHQRARVAVALDLQCCHLQGAHSKRVHIDGWSQRGCNKISRSAVPPQRSDGVGQFLHLT